MAACAQAIQDIEDILTDDDSVDYSPPQQPIDPQIQVHTMNMPSSDSDEINPHTPESATDSSLDHYSIEVIQPTEGLEIQLPINPLLRAPPTSPQSPRTNVAAQIQDELFTEGKEDGDQVVPLAVGLQNSQPQGRQQTLSPTLQVANSVEPSEQQITDRCSEVDFQLSNHRDWSQPHPCLQDDICNLILILFQSAFNTEGFPNLEKYLYETVGVLPYQPLLQLALDSVFEEFPEISVIQNKVYRMLKCHLSVINHSSITQFEYITLSNHDFDRVAGADLHSVSGPDSGPNLSTLTDLNETYYSVFSQAQQQALRVTERSLSRFRRDRANSCPNLAHHIDRELNGSLENNSHYMAAYERIYPLPNCL